MAAAHHGGRVRGPAKGTGDRVPDRMSHTTATTSADQPSQDHGGRGSAAAATVATASTHHTPQPTGAITTGPTTGTAPATTHAGSPTSITSPATGTATRLATVPDSESRPNTSTLGSSDAALRAECDRDGHRQRPEPDEPRREVDRTEHDTGGRADRQPETDRPAEQWVEQQQADDGHREQAHRLAPDDPARTPSPRGPP